MIVDILDNAKLYFGMGERIQRALAFLVSTDFSPFGIGTHEVEGDDIYFLIVETNTSLVSPEDQWESHTEYIDIHALLVGEELMGYVPTPTISNRRICRNDDDTLYTGVGNMLKMSKGMFMLLGPDDAHLPGKCESTPMEIRKVVMKIRR